LFYGCIIFIPYLCLDFGDDVSKGYGNTLKRESGVNPEQTRCCKLYQKSLSNTQVHCSERNGKGVQRWSKSEDLPISKVKSFLGLELETNKDRCESILPCLSQWFLIESPKAVWFINKTNSKDVAIRQNQGNCALVVASRGYSGTRCLPRGKHK
jgi:hypothetical protein